MNLKRAIAALLVTIIGVSAGLMVRHYRRAHRPLERGQCTWYALERAHDAGWDIKFDQPFGRHARAWWDKVTNAERGTEPKAGAIMVFDKWPGNPYGNV